MGQMNRAIAREGDDRQKQDRFASTLVIAAAIIAAVRLARDDISRPSPRLGTKTGPTYLQIRGGNPKSSGNSKPDRISVNVSGSLNQFLCLNTDDFFFESYC